jgi:hypothetical protein
MDIARIHLDTDRSVFIVVIEARPGAEGIRQLRALLKVLLRKHGFRCLYGCEIGGR